MAELITSIMMNTFYVCYVNNGHVVGRPLFPGNDHIDQLNRIMKMVGSPSPRLMQKIKSDQVSVVWVDLVDLEDILGTDVHQFTS